VRNATSRGEEFSSVHWTLLGPSLIAAQVRHWSWTDATARAATALSEVPSGTWHITFARFHTARGYHHMNGVIIVPKYCTWYSVLYSTYGTRTRAILHSSSPNLGCGLYWGQAPANSCFTWYCTSRNDVAQSQEPTRNWEHCLTYSPQDSTAHAYIAYRTSHIANGYGQLKNSIPRQQTLVR
jgi:hypothetical protein